MNKAIFGMVLSIMLITSAGSALAMGKTANVRVIHAAPDAPEVDVWLDGKKLFMGAGYGDFTDYTAVTPGDDRVQVVPAGATEPAVIDAVLELKNNRDYTVIATGPGLSIVPVILDDRRFAIPKQTASVRFVHASPNAPAVDIALKDGPVLFSDVDFRESEGYIRVPEGTYDLEVRAAGTEDAVLPLPGISFENGKQYTAIAVGYLGGSPALDALLVEDRGK